ncbi:hypothetical protein MAC_03981 [Metarhizium acridum CQMa 102]|uniref:Glycosyl hydrolase family 92 N-terminal domain-containing protein n=1 Tax=Metarhizium acridum (strain CQMa 102) TaxID=655827 RepID=E9E283_METAQ|nr:uncharacterized protein MAC_03981 [Metarhizium acridum CQMa 102]EFY89999.1 hypothetical protein MAC_03981 [Metarhizium acridum CQMa 102]
MYWALASTAAYLAASNVATANPSNHGRGSGLKSASYHDGAGVLKYVNPLIGTRGIIPDSNGFMISSVSTPFGTTRWTPQTRENYIPQVPYSDLERRAHGFQATHQPDGWVSKAR